MNVRHCFSLLFGLTACALLVTGCGPESENFIRKKLEIILEDDLQTLVAEIDSQQLDMRPRFEIVEYENYEKSVYLSRAVVDFFLFSKVSVKVVRKYRYHEKSRKWERYFNEYRFIHDVPGGA